MSAIRFRRAKEVFEQALALPDRRRSTYISTVCAGDPELEGEVRRLLSFDRQGCELLDREPGQSWDELFEEGEPESALDEVALPARIGPYRILACLGVGGMGIVYRAREDSPPRDVALKIVRSDAMAESTRRRFEHEVAILACLEHPGIARIYRAGTAETDAGPCPYFAMELVEGRPLLEYARAEGRSIRQRLELFATVLDAVHHAHERGVIHRDLKPENILVDGAGRTKVLDFGIARSLDGDQSRHTRTGQVVGTLAYMSPEQVLDGELDRRSDVYSLGVLLYELLCGQPPFDLERSALRRAVRLIQDRDPRPIGEVDPGLRGDLEAITQTALDKERDRRYTTAAAFAEDIRRFLRDEPILARPASTFYQMRKFARRHRALVGGALATAVALLLGTIVSVVFAVRADRDAELAENRRREATRSREIMRRSLYQAEMLQASTAIGSPQGRPRVREIVEAWRPAPGEADLRGWEWRLLERWSRPSERVLRPFHRVYDVDWHPDCRTIAACGEGALMVGDLETGEWTRLDVPPRNFHTVCWSRSGDRLAVGGQMGVWLFRNGPELELAWSLDVDGEVGRLLWSLDQEQIIVQPFYGPVRCYRTGDGHEVGQLPEDILGGKYLWSQALSPGGRSLAIVRKGGLALLDMATRQVETTLGSAPSSGIGSIAWNPADEDLLAVGHLDGTVALWKISSEERLVLHRDHGDRVLSLAWSPNGLWLASGGWDHTVRVWDPHQRIEVANLWGHQARLTSLDWSDDGQWLASAAAIDAIRVWNVLDRSSRRVRVSGDMDRPRAGLAWHPDGSRLAAPANGTAIFEIVSATIGQPATGRRIPEGLWGWNVSGERVALGSAGLLSTAAWGVDPAPRNTLHEADLIRVQWHPRDPTLLVMMTNSEVWVARDGDPGVVQRLEFPSQHLQDIAWAPQGNRVLIAGGKQLLLVDMDGSTVEELAASRHSRVASEPGSGLVAVAGFEGATRVLRSDTWETVSTLHDDTQQTTAAAWHPGGERLATADRHRMLKLWNVETGAMLARFDLRARVLDLAWEPAGRVLALLLDDGTVELWDGGEPR